MSAERAARWAHARAARLATVFTTACLLSSCEQGMKDMYHQDKYAPLDASQLWKDGRSARPLVTGTVPYSGGVAAETSSGVRGERPLAPAFASGTGATARAGQASAPTGAAADKSAQLQRGDERYSIFCTPCHGASGDGNGYIVLRGFPRPPSYHIDRLRQAPDSYIYGVIANGHGVMYGYGDRIDDSDRWAIVAYLRSLQLAHHELLTDTAPTKTSNTQGAKP